MANAGSAAGSVGLAEPGKTVLLCAAMQGVGGGLGWSLMPPLMPTVAKELSISHAMGGLIWGAASLGIAVASPLGGAAVDRYGARRVAGYAMLVGALTCAARAWATSGMSLAVLMLLFGAHVGFTAPAIPKALLGHVPLAKLGRANGLALLAYTLGTALSVLFARTLLAPMLGGWRNVMLAAGGLMALTSFVWLSQLRDRTVNVPHAGLSDVLAVAKIPAMRTIAVIHFLLFGGYLALLGLLPRGLAEAGLPLSRVGLAVAAWLLVAALGNAFGPALSDRMGRRRPFILFGGLVAGSALGLLALSPVGSPVRTVVLLCIAAAGGGCFAPLLLALPGEIREVGASRSGAALGFLMLVGQAGGFLLPMVSGALLGGSGLSAAIALLGLAHLAIVVPALFMRETGSKADRDSAAPAAAAAPAA